MKTFVMKVGALALGSLFATTAMAAPNGAVHSGGLLLKPDQLPAAARAALTDAYHAEKAQHPERFDAVAAVRDCTAEGYVGKRNPKPQCMPELHKLGREYGLAMLASLVFEAPRTRDGHVPYGTAVEQQAYVKAVLEAVGRFRLPQAAPVLYASLMQGNAAHWQSAADALGRLGGDAEARALVDLATTANPRQLAAISGLGECKRSEAVAALASLLGKHPQGEQLAMVADSLGRVASAWAWQAMGPSKAAMAVEVRTTAAKAAVQALATYSDATSLEQVRQALWMAEHPETVAMLQAAGQSAPADVRLRLEALARRYQTYMARR
ncbi:MAG: hypothetical protein HY902_03930 [Deltaproteobacteria bacterium]|nr:hypothetical protein [Deltaproteobacteria bacterium]